MATLKAKDRNKLPDSAFGIPSKRMYPLYKLDGDKLVPDKAHIESAARLFGHAANEDKPQLAKNILKAAKAAGIDSSGWTEVNKWANHGDKKEKSVKEFAVIFEQCISVDIESIGYNVDMNLMKTVLEQAISTGTLSPAKERKARRRLAAIGVFARYDWEWNKGDGEI